MRLVAVDTETELLRPGRLFPRLVCATFCGPDLNPSIEHTYGHATQRWLDLVKDTNTLTIYHNGVFDLGVLVDACRDKEDALRAVFNALDAGRIRDTMIRQKLFHIRKGDLQKMRKGSLSLAGLSALYLGEEMKKGEDTWRLRYGELMHVALNEWPEEAKHYALLDAKQTMRVFMAQDELFTKMKYLGAEPHSCRDEAFQMRAAWALQLMAAWGIRTNPDKVNTLEKELTEEIERHTKLLQGQSIIRLDGSQNMAILEKRVVDAYASKGLRFPLTKGAAEEKNKGKPLTDFVSTSRETLEGVVDVDPILRVVHERKHAEKILNTFVKAARLGTQYPLTSSFNVLVASTRTSCAGSKLTGGCNLQNLPKRAGVRECFEPRPGYLFCDVDYTTLEMRTWAQILYDLKLPDILRQALIAGRDPHIMVALNFVDIDYDTFKGTYKKDETLEILRDQSKPANYGFMGGLGPPKFVTYARQSDIVLGPTPEEALKRSRAIKTAWEETWQAKGYFQWINSLMNPLTELANVPLRSGLIRGGCRYTVAANTPFQALAAYGMKEALWRLAVEMYTDRSSDLYGSRGVAMIHDETLTEVPEEHAAPCAARVSTIMREAMETWTPNVPHIAEPKLMGCWDKRAKPVYDDEGDLVAWDAPDEAA